MAEAQPAGLQIPGHELIESAGVGGFSEVYLAHELNELKRRVAIKVITVKSDRDKATIARRFASECQILGVLSPVDGIIVPYTTGRTESGQPYLTMQYMEGGSVRERVDAEGPFAWEDAVDLILTVAESLGEAHDLQIIHHDIKPANILLTKQGDPKLGDFGVARWIAESRTPASEPGFTVDHAPPETFREGASRDQRSDLYSLSSTLYAMLSGNPPFWTNGATVVTRILDECPPPLDVSRVPREIAKFVDSGLAKRQDDRPQTCSEYIHALKQAREAARSRARDTTKSGRVGLPPAHQRRTAARRRGTELLGTDANLLGLGTAVVSAAVLLLRGASPVELIVSLLLWYAVGLLVGLRVQSSPHDRPPAKRLDRIASFAGSWANLAGLTCAVGTALLALVERLDRSLLAAAIPAVYVVIYLIVDRVYRRGDSSEICVE